MCITVCTTSGFCPYLRRFRDPRGCGSLSLSLVAESFRPGSGVDCPPCRLAYRLFVKTGLVERRVVADGASRADG
jgi:hypothetical protein